DTGVFRIDHDEEFNASSQIRYQYNKKYPWVAFTWRYDSGLVAGAVPDLASALALTADEQAQMGFYCGGAFATPVSPITSCSVPYSQYGATRIRIVPPGTYNPDRNPTRVAPRNVFSLGAGQDNLFHSERPRISLMFTVTNLTNTEALYNFLSTFSGTHFVAPRAYQVQLGFHF
ncbi:MAG: TonB-dependent receptor, partial [Acidobacteriota bacterium]|nr:TonB-dependent receptor [Acidobacteriota bacterium]